MKEIRFQDKTSQKIYDSYIERIKQQTKDLPTEDGFDILMEFNSHIYEGLQKENGDSEADKIVKILHKLGNPEEILKPTIAEKKLTQATQTFNPIHVFKALSLNIANGISYAVFSLLYLLLLGFGFLIFQKLRYPDEVGLYFKDGDFAILGKLGSVSRSHYQEVLGNWFIPVMILSAVILYFMITLLLKQKRKATR
ncbi:DUF1700 domain-containing protein [bacterium SCSIO 12741]|nr:DUF1700 domain-containing protein [bacterium SCSIO 12741]